MRKEQQQMSPQTKKVEQKLEKERTSLGAAVEVNKEKKLQGPNRPST